MIRGNPKVNIYYKKLQIISSKYKRALSNSFWCYDKALVNKITMNKLVFVSSPL